MDDQSVSIETSVVKVDTKSIGEALKSGIDRTFDIADKFLEMFCYPAANEYGQMWKDKAKIQRAINAARMLKKAYNQIEALQLGSSIKIHPRLIHLAIEEASWATEEEIQNKWAGLLVSSTSKEGLSDENLIFMNLLKQMSALEVKILTYCVENTKKFDDGNGLANSYSLVVSLEQLVKLFNENNLNRLDRELDHLREIGLIKVGINAIFKNADLAPSALGINLYVRAQGSQKAPVDYFELKTDIPRPVPDPKLMERFLTVEKKLRESLIKTIAAKETTGKPTPLEEFQNLSTFDLIQLAETFGINLHGPLSNFALFLYELSIPLNNDPEWKKSKSDEQIKEWEKALGIIS